MVLHLFRRRAQVLGGAETTLRSTLWEIQWPGPKVEPLSPGQPDSSRDPGAQCQQIPTPPRSSTCFPAAGRHAIPVLVGVAGVPNQIIIHVRLQREQKVLFTAGGGGAAMYGLFPRRQAWPIITGVQELFLGS